MMKEGSAALILVSLVVAIILGMGVLAADGLGAEYQAFEDRAAEWCAAENGTLITSMSVGHGGLHCQGIGASNALDGESVHMRDVAALNWTHDIERIKQRFQSRVGPLGMFTWAEWTEFGVSFALAVVLALLLAAYEYYW